MKNSEVRFTRANLIDHLFYCRDRVEALLDGYGNESSHGLPWIMANIGPVAILRLLRIPGKHVAVRGRLCKVMHDYLLGRLRAVVPGMEPSTIPDPDTLRAKLRGSSQDALVFSIYTMLHLADESMADGPTHDRQSLAYLALAYTDAATLKELEGLDVFDTKLVETVFD